MYLRICIHRLVLGTIFETMEVMEWLDLYDGLVEASAWYGNSIVFSDLDSIPNIVLSDLDESIPLTFVAQGSGAQLVIRYSEQHLNRSLKLLAIP